MARSTKEEARQKKEAGARSKAMFDKEITHIRMGDWRGTQGTEVRLLGTSAQLHGSVCTCCKGSINYEEKAA